MPWGCRRAFPPALCAGTHRAQTRPAEARPAPSATNAPTPADAVRPAAARPLD